MLKDHGLKLLSRITHLRVGMPEAEYSHILSFRRLVYIAPTDITIPETTTIAFEGTTYRIFMSTEERRCTNCNRIGHTQIQCPNLPIPTEIAEQTNNSDITTHQLPTKQTPSLHTANKIKLDKSKQYLNTNKEKLEIFTPPAPQPKKMKPLGHTETMLEPAKSFIESQEATIKPNITEIADFLDNSLKSKDIKATVHNYTNDLPGILTFLIQLHTQVKDRSIRVKITKIRKKLARKLEIDSTEDSDCSQSSS
nr:unnamed protein product [Callosobruchus analis]